MKGTINDSTLGAIAEAIRKRTGTDELILPHQMNEMIGNIGGLTAIVRKDTLCIEAEVDDDELIL